MLKLIILNFSLFRRYHPNQHRNFLFKEYLQLKYSLIFLYVKNTKKHIVQKLSKKCR